jgi:hypothetical protein
MGVIDSHYAPQGWQLMPFMGYGWNFHPEEAVAG